jgi:hypothetical protein
MLEELKQAIALQYRAIAKLGMGTIATRRHFDTTTYSIY